MKPIFYLAICLLSGCSIAANQSVTQRAALSVVSSPDINQIQWLHGAADCEQDKSAALALHKIDENSFIIRQNKCLTFEAPFIYVLVGSEKILILDTGALEPTAAYSLTSALKALVGEQAYAAKQKVVLHSHGHSDHYTGDSEFTQQTNTTLVTPTATGLKAFFNFNAAANNTVTLDLGERQITVLPTPGHQEEAITLYDHQNAWLLTGDTLYPGVVYVKDWQAYQRSIARLSEFAKQQPVSAILGAHIEMKNQAKTYYPIGTTYQPEEAPLALTVAHLHALNAQLNEQKSAETLTFDHFIIEPMNGLQRMVSNIARWFTQ